jgi:hypothetical protein
VESQCCGVAAISETREARATNTQKNGLLVAYPDDVINYGLIEALTAKTA